MESNPTLRCVIRAQLVSASPEEKVRQYLLRLMIEQLGYPRSLIVVEKKIQELPHLSPALRNLPNRRVDILCYAANLHPTIPLYPLLLVECKAVPLNAATIRQIAGYNYFIGAAHYTIANATQVETFSRGHKCAYLPSYTELLSSS